MAGAGSIAAQQQTGGIEGRVVTKEGTAIPAARVRLLESHREEMSHRDGSFHFDALTPGRYTVVAEHIGFRTTEREVDVQAGRTSEIEIQLEVAAIELSSITVTGALGRRAGRDVLSPLSIVSGAELDRELAATVAATLDDEPGISVTALGPATGRPVIRGLGGDRILVLEDGFRTGDMSSLSSDHAVAIDPSTARQVEVVRGPMSLLYGSSALGGVVNVIRDEIPRSVPEHATGGATFQGSTVDAGLSTSGSVLTGSDPWALRAELSARRSGDVATPVGDLVNTDARTFGGALGLARIGDHGHAGAAYRFYRNEYGIPGGFVGGHDDGVDVEMTRHAVRAEGELHREERFLEEIEASLSFTDFDQRELEHHHHDEDEEEEHEGDVGTRFHQELASVDLVARHAPRGALAQGALGLRGYYRDIQTGGSLQTPSTYDFGFAVFFVEEIGAGPTRFQIGARYDWARYVPRDTTARIMIGGENIPVRERTFGSFSGSVGVLHVFSDVFRVGASVARAYRTPDFNELYSDGPHLAANSYDVGDPSISEETGFGVDVFARVDHDRVRGELAVFRNQLDDYIFPSSRARAELGNGSGRPRFQYTNEDAVFTGAEADLQITLTPRLSLETTASLVLAEFTSDRAPIPVITGTDTTFIAASEHPPLIPPLHGRVGLRYERTRWFAGFGVRWASEQDRIGDFETPTAAYAIADADAGVRFFDGDRFHTITVRVQNAGDTEYRDHLSRIKDLMPGPGRDVRLLYRLTF